MSTLVPSPSPDSVLLTEGRFGDAVARRLGPDAQYDLASALSQRFSPLSGSTRAVMVASQRWPQRALEDLDQWARAHGVRWRAVFLHGRHLYGIRGGARADVACARCVWRRFLVQAGLAHVERALQEFYDRNGTTPPGFPPGAPGLAAAYLVQRAPAAQAPEPTVRCIDLLSGDWLQSDVVPLHGCTICRPARANKPDRFIEHLVPALGRGERHVSAAQPTPSGGGSV